MKQLKQMDKLVAFLQGRGFIFPGSKYTAAWQQLGLRSRWNSRIMSRLPGGKSLFKCPYNVGMDADSVNPQSSCLPILEASTIP